MRNIIIVVIALLAISCTSDEPMRPMAPRLNSGDSIALVALRDTLLTEVAFRYQWDFSKPEEMTGVTVKLDSITNQYRVVKLDFPRVEAPTLGISNDHNQPTSGPRIPKAVGNLTELIHCRIVGDILGPVPSELFNCPLKNLYIGGLYGPNGRMDHMSVPIEISRLIPTIEKLYFHGCNFKEGIPIEIFIALAEAPNIKEISFTSCKLEGTVLKEYCLPNCDINFMGNRFTNVDWSIFLNARYQVPYLYGNKIDKANVPEYVLQSPYWKMFGYRLDNQLH